MFLLIMTSFFLFFFFLTFLIKRIEYKLCAKFYLNTWQPFRALIF